MLCLIRGPFETKKWEKYVSTPHLLVGEVQDAPLKGDILNRYRMRLELGIELEKPLHDDCGVDAFTPSEWDVPVSLLIGLYHHRRCVIGGVFFRNSRVDEDEGVKFVRDGVVVPKPMLLKNLLVERDDFVLVLVRKEVRTHRSFLLI